jgi:hypothetical protein
VAVLGSEGQQESVAMNYRNIRETEKKARNDQYHVAE